MTTEQWEKLQEVFNRAVEATPADRRRLVRDELKHDPALLNEALSLLDEYARDPDFLEHSETIALDLQELDVTVAPGERVGTFRIVRRLGSGGMGAVYLAERDDDQFAQRVAIKVVKRGMDSEEIVARFRSERQIAATLDHPNIARLLDGGMTTDGRPYFVMEFVEGGIAIDEYCDRECMGVDDRLRLFSVVCTTVQYAHQNLVVHRDLKPANILVSSGGDVKLLDFGIAKILDPSVPAGAVAVTRTGVMMLTPEYASPEQIRGDTITTASDVYALGVLLYVLLTGHRPYALHNLTGPQIQRVVCETSPQRPSAIVMRSGENSASDGSGERVTPAGVAAVRGVRPSRLQRTLSGDLDNIVMKAMHKDPARRYASAAALADDIRRYLAGDPVNARGDSLGYRAGKFVRRHKVGVGAAGALFTSVAGFGVAMSVQAMRIRKQSTVIEHERDKSRRVVVFLKDLFRSSDPAFSRGEEITARQLLDRGAERIMTELADDPGLQAELLQEMGDVYGNLGALTRAVEIKRRCLELTLATYPHDSQEVALAMLGVAAVIRVMGLYDEATTLTRQSLEIQQKQTDGDDELIALTMNDLSLLLHQAGRIDESEELCRSALAMRRRIHGEEHRDVARSLNNLAGLLRRERDDSASAENLLRQAVAILTRLFGENHPDVAKGTSNLALTLMHLERFDEAEELDRKALAIAQTLFVEHPELATRYWSVGRHLLRRGELDKAEEYFNTAIDMYERLVGENHPDAVASMLGIAEVMQHRGNLDAAEDMYRRSISIMRTRRGDRYPQIGSALARLTDVLVLRGEIREAEQCLRDGLSVQLDAYGPSHSQVALRQLELGRLLIEHGDEAEAIELLERARTTLRGKRDKDADAADEVLREHDRTRTMRMQSSSQSA